MAKHKTQRTHKFMIRVVFDRAVTPAIAKKEAHGSLVGFSDWTEDGCAAATMKVTALKPAPAIFIENHPAPHDHLRGRPDGHCVDDEAWDQFSKDYGTRTRADLCKGDMSDFALANAQFMCDRNSLDLIAYQTAAKERIRWLSIQLARALALEGPQQ
jgi:hypothetical protein